MLSLWFYDLETIKLREIIKFSLSSLCKPMIKTNTSFVIADIHTSRMKFLSNPLEVLLQRDVLLQQTIEPNKRVMCFMIGKTNFFTGSTLARKSHITWWSHIERCWLKKKDFEWLTNNVTVKNLMTFKLLLTRSRTAFCVWLCLTRLSLFNASANMFD